MIMIIIKYTITIKHSSSLGFSEVGRWRDGKLTLIAPFFPRGKHLLRNLMRGATDVKVASFDYAPFTGLLTNEEGQIVGQTGIEVRLNLTPPPLVKQVL